MVVGEAAARLRASFPTVLDGVDPSPRHHLSRTDTVAYVHATKPPECTRTHAHKHIHANVRTVMHTTRRTPNTVQATRTHSQAHMHVHARTTHAQYTCTHKHAHAHTSRTAVGRRWLERRICCFCLLRCFWVLKGVVLGLVQICTHKAMALQSGNTGDGAGLMWMGIWLERAM